MRPSVARFGLAPFHALAFLVLALPFHVFVFRALAARALLPPETLSVLALWKEGLMALLLLFLLGSRLAHPGEPGPRLYLFDLGFLSVGLLLCAYSLVAPRLDAGLFGLRNYFEPFVVFYLVRWVPATAREMRALLWAMLAVAGALALFALYQAAFWDMGDLYTWGFAEADSTIPTAFFTALAEGQVRLRAASAVTGPNALGLILSVAVVMAAALLTSGGQSRRLAAGLSLLCCLWLAGLFCTYSRSALVALAVGLAALFAARLKAAGPGSALRNALKGRSAALVIGLLFVVIAAGAIRSGVHARFVRAFQMKDPSALGHVGTIFEAVPLVLDHPFGMGTGIAGQRARRFASEIKVEHVESTYAQLMLEIGVPATLCFIFALLLLVSALHRLHREAPCPFAGSLLLGACASWLGCLAAFVFLPMLQELQVMSFLWALTALSLRLPATGPDGQAPGRTGPRTRP